MSRAMKSLVTTWQSCTHRALAHCFVKIQLLKQMSDKLINFQLFLLLI